MICATGEHRATLQAVRNIPYLLTEDEAAELLGMSASNLRQRRRRRVNGEPCECPMFIRLGRRIRYLSRREAERDDDPHLGVYEWGKWRGVWTGKRTPDHRAAGQFGMKMPRGRVLTDAQVCAVLRISTRDARDLRTAALDGRADAYPSFSRENRSVVVRREDLVAWVESLAKRDESLDDALDRRAS